MDKVSDLVTRISRFLDRLAGLCLVSVMVLVVGNILLRALFKSPIMGAYELVGLLTAIAIGLALASCAVQNGHIAVGIVVDRLPCRWQSIIDALVNVAAMGFWAVIAWHISKYAYTMDINGVVTSTTQIPLSPVIYLVALGVAGLCLVLLIRFIDSLRKAVS